MIFLVAFLSVNVGIFGSGALDGPNQIALIMSAALAVLLALRSGRRWQGLQEGIVKNTGPATIPLLMLLVVGSLSGTWLLSGIVPAMVYYGLQIFDPSIFLVAAAVVCSVVSLATGSSWTTVATVGVAFGGIGEALGMPRGMVAGAILSGSYFGDKMSPLSDTTNLASAMAGAGLFAHIRHMAITAAPSMALSLLVFLILGLSEGAVAGPVDTGAVLAAISGKFHISFWLFAPPIVVAILIVRKMPALPVLLAGTLLGAVFALIFQPGLVAEAGGGGLFAGIMKSLYGSISFDTGNEVANGLLGSDGMSGMLGTVWLILSAMVFGGAMESSGMLKRIARAITGLVRGTGALIASTAGTCLFFNAAASDQYLAIVVPGRMYSDIYKRKNLAPQNLSRVLEDSGTVTSALIPWNTCGAYHSAVLGIPAHIFAPYCFFNIISPLMTILVGYMGYKITKINPKEG